MASAAIGFAQYFGYIIHLNEWQSKFISGGLILFIVLLLYRKIEAIGKISILLWMGVLLIMAWIIGGGVVHGHFLEPIKNINEGLHFDHALLLP